MIGAILAGGYGKRLKPLTDDIPKALVQIKKDYSILDRQIFDFRNAGIREIYFLTGHLGERIEEKYGKEKDSMKFHYLKEEKPLGTLYSLRGLIEATGNEDILLRNGDTITDLNFPRFIQFADESTYSMVIFVTRMKSPYGIVELLGDSIVNFREKPYLDSYINSGVYVIKKEAFSYFQEEYNFRDLEKSVFPRLASLKMLGGYREETLWMGIDSEKDLEQIRAEYRGRTDYPWGYTKLISEEKGITVKDYYLKSGDSINIPEESEVLIRVVSGSILVRNGEANGATLNRGDTLRIGPESDVRAVENSLFECIF